MWSHSETEVILINFAEARGLQVWGQLSLYVRTCLQNSTKSTFVLFVFLQVDRTKKPSVKLPEDHRIKSENTDQSGRVLSDRSTKPVFSSPTTMLTDEEKARIHQETALLMEKNKQEKELWERQQKEQKEKLRREEQERKAGKTQDAEERDPTENQHTAKDGQEKKDSKHTKTEDRELSADGAQEATGTQRQSKSEHEASDAKVSVEGKRCPTSEAQKRPADVSPASVSGELNAGKVGKTNSECV